jgi:class 3 adenylate cyclase
MDPRPARGLCYLAVAPNASWNGASGVSDGRTLVDRRTRLRDGRPRGAVTATGARRLAGILAADVAGYSRLMGADEEGTLARLKAHRRELVDPKIAEHHGRIVKTTGDGMLVEFASVVDAVRCAVDVQRDMALRNTDVPADRRIEFRIGINLGDIIKDGREIYGDGVNVAARLEALAAPGGICVSRVVRDQVRDKLGFAFDDRGEQQVKNIARPVRVFDVNLIGDTMTPAPDSQPERRCRFPRSRRSRFCRSRI